jgi:hypothetical protein
MTVHISELIQGGEWEVAEKLSVEMVRLCLEGLRYYQTCEFCVNIWRESTY